MEKINEGIKAEVEAVSLVDTHEHILPEAERNQYAVDFGYLFAHYNTSDLVSAGMPPRLLEAVAYLGEHLSGDPQAAQVLASLIEVVENLEPDQEQGEEESAEPAAKAPKPMVGSMGGMFGDRGGRATNKKEKSKKQDAS